MHLHEKQNFKLINKKEGDNLLRLNTAVSRKVVQQNRTRQWRKVLWVIGVHGP